MIEYHTTENGVKIAELVSSTDLINSPEDILDLMVDVGYNGCNGMILHDNNLNQDFFDLKTKLAGEILQKFSNYRMKLAIIGDFSEVKSKSLRDFIRECNRGGTIFFVSYLGQAIKKLDRC
jgi:hypothetical protein